jgi:hypothetical protein
MEISFNLCNNYYYTYCFIILLNCINFISQEDSIFGLKRTKRIEIVKPKDAKKKKTGNVTAAALLNTTLTGAMGLGMTRPSGNSKTLKIDNVSFGKYSTGTLALGFILQIMDNFLVISLPGGVTGTVSISEISDSLYRLSAESINDGKKGKNGQQKGSLQTGLPDIKTLVSPMQPVRCYVINVIEKTDSKKKSLVLSMRSTLVNRGLALKHLLPGFPISGCVSSKEDHGYVISGGVSGVTFFLPFKAVPAALALVTEPTKGVANEAPTGENLPIGQPVECVVEAVNEAARSVTLRAQVSGMYVWMYFYMYICVNVCICMSACMNISEYVSVFMYVCIYIYMYIYIYACRGKQQLKPLQEDRYCPSMLCVQE